MTRVPNKNLSQTNVDVPRKSGRAVIEQDGRSIWEWQTATGVFERDVSFEQLAKLEDAGLELVDEEQNGRSIYEGTDTHTIGARDNQSRSQRTARADSGADSAVSRWFKRIVARS